MGNRWENGAGVTKEKSASGRVRKQVHRLDPTPLRGSSGSSGAAAATIAKKDAEILRLRELVEEQERQIREMKKAMY